MTSQPLLAVGNLRVGSTSVGDVRIPFEELPRKSNCRASLIGSIGLKR